MPRESVFTGRFKREVPRESVFTGWFKGKVPRESVFIGRFKGEGPRESVRPWIGENKPRKSKVWETLSIPHNLNFKGIYFINMVDIFINKL